MPGVAKRMLDKHRPAGGGLLHPRWRPSVAECRGRCEHCARKHELWFRYSDEPELLGCSPSMDEGELSQPLVVLSDVHLSATGRSEVANDLAELVRASAGHELILAGDVF